MTTKKIELEVDFIGGFGPLTSEEEKIISEYIKTQKIFGKQLPLSRKPHPRKQSKSVV